MEEKTLNSKKNGMLVLVLSIVVYVAATIGTIWGAYLMETQKRGTAILVVSISVLCVAWIFWPGLKVLKPQEALVLTLFV